MIDKKQPNDNKKMVKKNKPIHGAKKLLNHNHLLLNKKLKELMIEFFASMDVFIIDLIKHSKTDSESIQQLYLESLNSMRIHKLNVMASLLNTVKQTFILFEKSDFDYFDKKITNIAIENTSDTDSFDKNDVDEKLVQNILIHKYETSYEDQLLAFQKRFSAIINNQLEPYQVPIGPFVLISAFAKSIRLLHLDIKFKLILYKHFDSQVMSKIDGLYAEINLYLNNNGIVTGLENKIFNKRSEIKNKQKPSIKKDNKDLSTILSVLTTIQQKFLYQLTPVELKNTVLTELKQSNVIDQAENISRYDKDAINLVTMIFQLIAGDRNIPTSIKSIIAKLQIPYFRAAIQDSELLANKKHPAQILLNVVCKASVGWQAKTDTKNTFFNNTHSLVESILNKTHLSSKFFTAQLIKYRKFIAQETNDFKDEQERVEEKLKGRDRIVLAMKTIEALLAHKTENTVMPDLIRNVIMGPWKNLLVLLLVRHSDTAEEYILKVHFIDDLIQAVQSGQYEVIIRKNVEALCIEYEEGLRLVAYGGEGLDNKVLELKQCIFDLHHIKYIKPSRPIVTNSEGEKEASTVINPAKKGPATDHIKTKNYAKVSDRDFEPIKSTIKPNNSIFADLNVQDKKLITGLKPGCWFHLERRDKQKAPVRAQLSWISPKTGMYLFVNSRGLKVAGKTPKEMVDALKNKNIVPVK